MARIVRELTSKKRFRCSWISGLLSGSLVFAYFFAGGASVKGQPILSGGIDPSHLGKGDWITQVSAVTNRMGVATIPGMFQAEANLGLQWITVKCGDGTNFYSQFDSNLVAQAHAAGLKIFAWAYVYGQDTNETAEEIKIALKALNLGADGFIVDAEADYEDSANNQALAAQYCQGILTAYPSHFLACSVFAKLSAHPNFPYAVFGYYCHAIMPEAFWADAGIAPNYIISQIDNNWTTWQNNLSGTNRNAIKPIVPVGQSYSSPDEDVTGDQLAAFLSELKSDVQSPNANGYNGASFFDSDWRDSDMDLGVQSISFKSAAITPPSFKGIQVLGNGQVQLIVQSSAGAVCEVDQSANAIVWKTLTTFTNLTGSYQFTDMTASNVAGFYRVKSLSQ